MFFHLKLISVWFVCNTICISDCRASDYKVFGRWWSRKDLEGSVHVITEVLLSTLLEVLSKTTEFLGSDRGYHGWDSNLAPLSANQVLLLGPTVSVWELSLTGFYSVSLLLSFRSVLVLHHRLCRCRFHCPSVINFVVRLSDPNY